jgi:DNA mismatch repair ATPase MutS
VFLGHSNYVLSKSSKSLVIVQVPLDFERGSGKKGVQRYHTPAIKELLAELAEAEQEKEDALKEIFRKLLQHFCRWVSVCPNVAKTLDSARLAKARLC